MHEPTNTRDHQPKWRPLRQYLTIGIMLFFTLPCVTLSEALAADIAIIVNNQNPTTNLSWTALVRILKLDKLYWEGNGKIYLVLRETGSEEKESVLQKVYKTNDVGLKKLWLGKINREEIVEFPRVLNSNEAIIRFVNQVPSAIGFIDASYADSRVKALRIDGYLPGDEKYPLGDE